MAGHCGHTACHGPGAGAAAHRDLAQHGIAAAGPLRLRRRDLVVAGAQLLEDRRLLPLELARHLEGEACHLCQPHTIITKVRLHVTGRSRLCRALCTISQAGPPARICIVRPLHVCHALTGGGRSSFINVSRHCAVPFWAAACLPSSSSEPPALLQSLCVLALFGPPDTT